MKTKIIKNSNLQLQVLEETKEIMFADLSPEGIQEAVKYAQHLIKTPLKENEINPLWHPVVQDQLIRAIEKDTEDIEQPDNAETIKQLNPTKKIQEQALWYQEGSDVSYCQSLQDIMLQSGLNFSVKKSPVTDPVTENFSEILRDILTESHIQELCNRLNIREQDLPDLELAREVNNQYQVKRQDNNLILTSHSVTGRYHTCQNLIFMKALEDLRLQNKIQIDVAGSTNYGSKVFCIARFTDVPQVDLKDNPDMPSDIVQPYLGFWSSHDGSLPVIGKFLSYRHNCCNMSAAGWNNKGIRIHIRHTKSVNEKVSNAAEVLLKIRKNWVQTLEIYKKLKQCKLSKDQALKLIPKILDIKLDKEKADPIAHLPTRQQSKILEINDLYSDQYFDNHGENAFDLYQAITAYNTHRRKIRGETSRFDSVALGSGFDLENKAFNVLSDLVTV